MPRRVKLVIERQLRALGERRVKDARVRLGEQQPGRLAGAVADDLAARRRRCFVGISDRAQGGGVEQRSIIKMQQKDRRLRCDGIELVDRRQPFLGELMFGEATDDAHPLRRRGHLHLALQHRHRIGQRTYAVPAQLHVEVETAADDVKMVVNQAGQHALTLQINEQRVFAGERHHLVVAPDRRELAVSDRDGACRRVGAIERCEQSAMQDEVRRESRCGGHNCASGSFAAAAVSARGLACRPGSSPNKCWAHFASR